MQNTFLQQLTNDHIPVLVYLINGIKLQGQIESFDDGVIFLRNTIVTQMVYKHAISTIAPVGGRAITSSFAS